MKRISSEFSNLYRDTAPPEHAVETGEAMQCLTGARGVEVSPVQSLPVGSEKQSWIVFKLVVRELQVVPSHLAANTKTNQL